MQPGVTLVIGAARAGKTAFAERLAARHGPHVCYVATAEPLDDDMRTRIAAHRADRPPTWRTIEAPLDRKAMARFAGVTERHLDRLFSTHLGSTFTAEYRRLRLDRARALLQQSALAISEIAVACGYSTPAHFARCYRQQYGMAPSAARRAP